MQSRKAIEPIIATLLLAAIAVVGGIIVFAWSNGMFSSSNMSIPPAESMILVGYDTRDTPNLTNFDILDNTPDQMLKVA